jgi:hypothetical protein
MVVILQPKTQISAKPNFAREFKVLALPVVALAFGIERARLRPSFRTNGLNVTNISSEALPSPSAVQ